MPTKKGFTLIEILVVIGVIGIIVAAGSVAYSNSQEKSKDKRRKSDIEAIRQALVIAKQDDGYYKIDLTSLTPKYIKSIPQDPVTNQNYIFVPGPTIPLCDNTSTYCTNFTLTTCLENANDPQQDSSKNSSCSTPASYTLTSPQ